MVTIVGLGNPGEEYEKTRHNTGRIMVYALAKKYGFPEFEFNKKINALISKGEIEGKKATLVLPETFMNKSGNSLTTLITSAKKAENLVVIYDEIDLPFGSMKIAFDRGSGGHRGVDSVIKSLKTKAFVRFRIGITPTTKTGELQKPKGEQKVLDFIMGSFKKNEEVELKKVSKQVAKALACLVTEGRAAAMNQCN